VKLEPPSLNNNRKPFTQYAIENIKPILFQVADCFLLVEFSHGGKSVKEFPGIPFTGH
jgi:hypothetical protein